MQHTVRCMLNPHVCLIREQRSLWKSPTSVPEVTFIFENKSYHLKTPETELPNARSRIKMTILNWIDLMN